MRKTLFTLAGLLVTIIANAYTCVTFNSGDPSILLKEAYISYEFDWDHARVTNHDNLLWNDYLRKRGDDFVKDWPKDRKKVEEYFTIRFNKKSDFLQIKDKSPIYKMIVRPKTIDVGNGGSAFNPWASSKAGGCIINGTIDFYDAATNQLLCVLNIVEAKGTGSPSETTRIGVTLMEVAGDIWDFVEDEVAKGKVKGTPIAGQAAAYHYYLNYKGHEYKSHEYKGHEYKSHEYKGHEYKGHEYKGYDNKGHNYKGHNHY